MLCQFQMYSKVNQLYIFSPIFDDCDQCSREVYVNVNSGSHVNGKKVKGASFMSTSNSINEITR